MLDENKIEIKMPGKHPLLLDKKSFYSLCRLFLSNNANCNYELFITIKGTKTDADFDRIRNFFSEDEVLNSPKNILRITTIFGYVHIIKK